MADEPAAAPAAAPGTPPAAATDLGAPTRITPNTSGDEGPSLEEQAAAQEAAAKPKEGEAPAPKAGEEAPKPKEGEEAPKPKEGETPAPVEALKGTIFETLSPEMQTKVAPFAAAYAENGTLTEAEITEAAHATGMSEAVVRQFMAGAAASSAMAATPIYEQAGGPEAYQQFQAWTAKEGSLTPAEERNINKALGIGADGQPIKDATPDYDMAKQLMAPAMDRWKASGGAAPARDVTGEGAGGTNGAQQSSDVYESWAQLTADQGKSEYRNDPAFRARVEAKIARSPKLA